MLTSGRVRSLFIALVVLGSLHGCSRGVENTTVTGASEENTTNQGSESVAARQPGQLLALNNTRNTRGLGGYTTADGRRVKFGALYRADSLAKLDEADLAALAALELAAVTDFRSEVERTEAPDRLPEQTPPIDYRTLGINNPVLDVAEISRKLYAGELGSEELLALTDRRSYVKNTEISRQWGQWLASLVEPGQLPHLFHCTAGKDRTGFAAAIILLTLGVDEDQVMHDFLLTNTYLDEHIDAGIEVIQSHASAPIDKVAMRQVLGVAEHSMADAIQAMKDQYGSIDGFVAEGLGIDAPTRKKLQSLLLE